MITACGDKSQVSITSKSKQPDFTIDTTQFYLNSCHSLTGVFNHNGTIESKVILTFPYRPLSVCTDKQSQLNFDGTYLTVKICRTSFGAGGCGVEKFRTKDFENWQEYIGITWHDNEQYEAWRRLGSNSTKADEITKVVPVL
ncbi:MULTISPECIES: hypothetical protein [unclassified Pseudoalteromonas]|uniref:hypothetical protein n=1 Tax=unclassified Pseudoalteromonas TaxID=194690 RepID=UPI000C943F8C|nr:MULTISPECIES: hypothetical protein [unclassified Pseudoalteromonas]MAD05734.1 hypothetical protein [Pseudoalteromonas sp.]MCP4588190.1 hypothetical protein [Pseudoalteromonas sp.]NIZ07757.1 hypothetical protein [Pseudoalteromonas sp. HF66]RZD22462.1 hypothetical protein EVU92_10545 [Pseudoalteromonas sp. MEBiC 03485]